MENRSPTDSEETLPKKNGLDLAVAAKYSLWFVAIFAFFFLVQSREVIVYDEGIMFTGAMRVVAGQVIHRDFYYNYGPALIYLLAGLFKIFGPSALLGRILLILGCPLVILSVFSITRKIAGRSTAILAALLMAVWCFAVAGITTFLVSLILWSTWLITAAFSKELPKGKAFVAGLLVAAAALFRYDMGTALIACHLVAVVVACWLRFGNAGATLKATARSLWPYFVGVLALLGPYAWAYLSVAPLHDLLFDIVLYTAKYYRVARGLPFPNPLHLSQFQDLVVYLVPVLIAAQLLVATTRSMIAARRQMVQQFPSRAVGVFVAFSLVTAALYLKATVRIGAGGLFPALVLCAVTAPVLYSHRRELARPISTISVALLTLLFATGAFAGLHVLSALHKSHGLMLARVLEPSKMPPYPPVQNWCGESSVITRGACFLLDADHIQTTEYILAHTVPGDTLFVGLPHHDRIFINDNITYFATQRLPATKWSHFDPFLQNSVETQQEMTSEFERNRPPYIVEDSEFDAAREPNGSSTSTGVHILDDYIAQHYHLVQKYGEMTILQRN